jgi:hypothetical protein
MHHRKQNKLPLIIELNGLPGSGKSTVTNLLFERLQKSGDRVKVVDKTYEGIYKGKYHKLSKLIHHGGIKLPFLLSGFFLSIKPFNIDRYKFIRRLILYYLMYMKEAEENNYDIILADGGIIHFVAASIYPDHANHIGSLKKLLNTILNTLNIEGLNYFVADCLSNETISAERIKGRNHGRSRFDKMKTDNIKPMLKRYNANFPTIRRILNDCQWINRVELDMRQTPEQNCTLLLDRIALIRKDDFRTVS